MKTTTTEITLERKPASPRGKVDRHVPIAYETDFHKWLLDQAAILSERQPDFIDWQHIAEELEAMAAGERRALRKQLKRLLLHLLKFRGQPEQMSRPGGWRRSIREAREEIEDILVDSPGILGGKAEHIVAEAYVRARDAASEETHLPLKNFPERCPWSFEHIMRHDFVPDSPRSN